MSSYIYPTHHIIIFLCHLKFQISYIQLNLKFTGANPTLLFFCGLLRRCRAARLLLVNCLDKNGVPSSKSLSLSVVEHPRIFDLEYFGHGHVDNLLILILQVISYDSNIWFKHIVSLGLPRETL